MSATSPGGSLTAAKNNVLEDRLAHGRAERVPRAWKADRLYPMGKRTFDIAFSAVVLAVTAPVLGVAAVALKLDSPGPVFFRQTRMGRHGRSFELVKLRGMYVDARERFPELYDYAAWRRSSRDSFYFHTPDDPRVTRVGRLLRRFSIDELPNFWNVLRGDMSVVGPRPEILELAHLYDGDLPALLSVRPGVTSPSKALGRDTLSFGENLASDLDYVARRSFRLDLVTIAQTIRSVVRGHGVKS